MVRHTMSDDSGFNRRNFVKGAGSAAVIGTISVGTVQGDENGIRDPEEEVKRLGWMRHTNHEEIKNEGAKPEREPQYYTISRRRWLRNEGALQAAHDLRDEFGTDQIKVGVTNRISGSRDIGVGVYHLDQDTQDGLITPDISIDKLESIVPSSVSSTILADGTEYTSEGIPVTVVDDKRTPQASAESYFAAKYRPVPGGVEGGRTADPDRIACTLASPAYHTTWGNGITTASHCLNRSEGLDIYQNSFDSDNKIGVSKLYTEVGDGDVGFIDRTVTTSYQIGKDGGGYAPWTIQGTVQKDRLLDMVSWESNIYVQGSKTGRNYDNVVDLVEPDHGDVVIVDVDTSGGDSGGLYFETRNDDEAYAVGIHAWESGDETQGSGNTMYYAEDALNITV